ncbi:MAG: (E)-4-hydroxy-3-methylbut-2-enyl-diphosphate synthase [Paludibacteraceae bacterium]|nr:(E)-4-hydroxy-3-methylbut-2-enyl-diphosphate synthase [Paludibacteraceae bacterium]
MRDWFNYNKRATIDVKIADLSLGGNFPIRVQSMGNTDTNDIEASVSQAERIAQAGGEIVRFTAQGIKEANNLGLVRNELRKRGCNVPLVADIHFNPAAAMAAATNVEKVRINPGNYVDSTHTQKTFQYTDEEYAQEIEKIKEKLIPFLDLCKQNNTAVRIGVNHGSLSDRILSRYGDTSEGMVESCLEFLRICKSQDFLNVVVSIKASNVVIMVRTVRLLAEKMDEEGLNYPIHLGVTEAGEGEDGRIKSAAGITALLLDGIGDTIRVSLSEDPEAEIPVAKMLADYVQRRSRHALVMGDKCIDEAIRSGKGRTSKAVGNIGGDNVPVVITKQKGNNENAQPDYLVKSYTTDSISIDSDKKFQVVDCSDIELATSLPEDTVILARPCGRHIVGEIRALVSQLIKAGKQNPVVALVDSPAENLDELQLFTAADMGALLIDRLIDGICLISDLEESATVCHGILQATRRRIFKTEFISCPSCGRTLYDMQNTLAKVKSALSHLKGLKIGVMGCIVNGPGEMADADYGYVGSGRGKVNLYKGKNCVEKMVPEDDAVDKLIQLIKDNGDWIDK